MIKIIVYFINIFTKLLNKYCNENMLDYIITKINLNEKIDIEFLKQLKKDNYF